MPHVPEHDPEEQAEAERDDERWVPLAVGGQTVEPHDLLKAAHHGEVAQQGRQIAPLRLEGAPVLRDDDGMGGLPSRQRAQRLAGLLGHPARDDRHAGELAPHPAECVNALHGVNRAVEFLQLETILPRVEGRHLPILLDLRLQKIQSAGQLIPAAQGELLHRRLEHAQVHPGQELIQRLTVGALAKRGDRHPLPVLEERKEQDGTCGADLPQPLPVLRGQAPQRHPAVGGGGGQQGERKPQALHGTGKLQHRLTAPIFHPQVLHLGLPDLGQTGEPVHAGLERREIHLRRAVQRPVEARNGMIRQPPQTLQPLQQRVITIVPAGLNSRAQPPLGQHRLRGHRLEVSRLQQLQGHPLDLVPRADQGDPGHPHDSHQRPPPSSLDRSFRINSRPTLLRS